jgi:enolase-phosphatase E1
MTETSTTPRALLLDIEGTVTSISFVHDILFPFARTHVRDYLIQQAQNSEVHEMVAALRREYALDLDRGEQLPQIVSGAGSIDAIVAYIDWLIDRDRKSPALKSLQGKIWEHGYDDGTLKAPLFDDVVPNLRRLRQLGIKVAIFSSGSVLAQKLLFAHTESGDHTDMIDRYFDTAVGSKVSSESYRVISTRLDLAPNEIIFVSDVTGELIAAREAGMSTLLCVRVGNTPQAANEQFQTIESFSEILPVS